MEYRNLGRSGLQVSLLCLGGNVFGRVVDVAGTDALIGRAIELGVNFLDTADTYTQGESETLIGKALKGRRHQMLVATKGVGAIGEGPNNHQASRKHLVEAVEASLRRLDTDYIDLYQTHAWDPTTPLDETLRTLDDLVRQGKIRYVGSNGYKAWHISEAQWLARTNGWAPMVSEQPEYSLLERFIEREIVPAALTYGVGIIPHYVIAGGLLTGKYRRGEPLPEGSRFANWLASPRATGRDRTQITERWNNERYWTLLDALERFAKERECTVGDVAIAWCAARPAISSLIIAATKLEQLEQNVRALELRLSEDELRELDAITR